MSACGSVWSNASSGLRKSKSVIRRHVNLNKNFPACDGHIGRDSDLEDAASPFDFRRLPCIEYIYGAPSQGRVLSILIV
jgi:hypothetical protein